MPLIDVKSLVALIDQRLKREIAWLHYQSADDYDGGF
jgi:hypothetical protein